MRMKWVIAAMAMLACSPAAAGAPDRSLAARMLAVHNAERARVGVPPLAWSDRLAADAAAYAPALIALGDLEHSSNESRPDSGENLAMGTRGFYSPEDLSRLWVDERSGFPGGGVYPEPDEDDWSDIGHYTQMVWGGTREVGCATAAGGGNLYLVCRYAPAGNVIGEPVLLSASYDESAPDVDGTGW
jgi:hypothetical protein